MKKTILIISFFLALLIAKAQSQTFQWAKSTNKEYDGNAQDIATDALGNVYITGTFSSSTIKFGDIILNKVSASSGTDVFIAKFDKNGNVLWAKNTSILKYVQGSSIAIATDANSNVFITGAFDVAAANFNGTILTHTSVGSSSDIFIVKYDAQGNLLWAKNTGYTNTVWVYDIATDTKGNALITGSFSNAPLAFGNISIPSFANVNPFLVKYDPSGNVIWAKGATQTKFSGVTVWGYGVATDANDNIFITGDYAKTSSSNLSFGKYSLPICNGRNLYVVKYDNLGNELWAKASAGNTYGGVQATGFDVTADLNGNCIVTGSFNIPTINFGTITLTNSSTINDISEIFVLKYNSSGNEVWAKKAGGTSDDEGHKISTDKDGNTYVTGYFKSKTATFGSITVNKSNSYEPLFFVVKYNDLGNEVWVKFIEKTNAYGGGLMTNGVSADDYGNLYVTGNALNSDQYGTAIFGTTSLTLGGIFIAKLGESKTENDELNENNIKFTNSPNPTSGIITISSSQAIANVEVFDVRGKLVYTQTNNIKQTNTELDLSALNNGIYFIHSQTENGGINKSKVVVSK